MILNDIVQISEEMLKFAKNNRWDEVQKLEIERQSKLSDYFTGFNPESVTRDDERLLQEISNLNSLLVDSAIHVKQEFISVATDALHSTKAVQKYKKHEDIK